MLSKGEYTIINFIVILTSLLRKLTSVALIIMVVIKLIQRINALSDYTEEKYKAEEL